MERVAISNAENEVFDIIGIFEHKNYNGVFISDSNGKIIFVDKDKNLIGLN